MTAPTAAELAAMPYKGVASPSPTGLDAGGLAALDYNGDPDESTGGLAGAEYEKAYATNPKGFLWWKAYRAEEVIGAFGPNGEVSTADGLILVQQDTTGFLCKLYNTRRDLVDEQYGLIEKGATGFSSLPSQVIIARHDRISFPNTISVGRQIVKRDGTSSSGFDRSAIQVISEVIKLNSNGNSVVVPSDEYTVGDDARSISWLSNTTTGSGDFCSIEYQYLPMWEWLEDGSKGVVQQGVDGIYLPQRGVLIQRQPE